MRKLLLCLTLLLAGCNQSPKQGADGYAFGNKQFSKNTVQINVVTYSNEREMQKVAAIYLKGSSTNPSGVAAFSVIRPPFDVCTIHMIDPAVRYEPEFVGHEFLHCVYGQWHKDNGTR